MYRKLLKQYLFPTKFLEIFRFHFPPPCFLTVGELLAASKHVFTVFSAIRYVLLDWRLNSLCCSLFYTIKPTVTYLSCVLCGYKGQQISF